MKAQNLAPICFIFGTRPEIIKIAPVIKECLSQGVPFFTLHTGQHYSENMDSVFWVNLQLPPVNYNLHVGSGSHAVQTAKMLVGIENVLIKEKPGLVLVQGDTNSVLAGALVASKLNIPVGHIEAGLRSYDRTMPEEVNRVIAGVIASLHFAPTNNAKENLLLEGINESKISVTGNTVVDALYQNVDIANSSSEILKILDIQKDMYCLLTVHRAENTDDKTRLTSIIESISEIALKYNYTIIWPMHPRTKKQIESFQLSDRLKCITNLKVIEPVDYFDMITLQSNSRLIITDSGGIQEESCILRVPCITLRNNTERPESIGVGANLLTGTNKEDILKGVSIMLKSKRDWVNPFGDGTASKKIVENIR